MTANMRVPVRERNIVFIGFMGVGKTTVGRLVAKKLYRDFIDIDQEIEKAYNMPVSHIFAQWGEAKFREIERERIVDVCTNTRLKVISLGGGAYMQQEVRDVCLSHGIVIFLDLPWESWKDRLPLIIDSRPVLKNKSLDEIEQLFIQRKKIYDLHNSKMTTTAQDAEAVAEQIVASLKMTWDMDT